MSPQRSDCALLGEFLKSKYRKGCHPRGDVALYFVSEEGRIKVGYSKDATSRIRQLQTANPRRLTVIDIVQGDKRDEALLHQRLKSMGKHLTREWFVDDPEVRAVLSSYSGGSLYRDIQREKALRHAQSILDDMGKAIERLRALLKKR